MKRLTLSKPYHSESRSLWYVILENTKEETDWETIASFPRKDLAETYLDDHEYCEACGDITSREGALDSVGLYSKCGACGTPHEVRED